MSRYIDADKLKEHASHYVRTQPHFHYGDWDNMCISGKEVDEIIDTCTAADVVEVRHGEWVPLSGDGYADGEIVYDTWECSECHEEFISDGEPPLYNYCPNCGAKMKGADDES